jgi:RHS repeat-associated protein
VALYTAGIGASDNARTLIRTNNSAIYANNQLYVTIIKDENWKPADECIGITEEYKDKEGRIVLKRSYNKKGSLTEMLSTYYVYDDFGNLCFVLPPASSPDADAAISSTTLENLCYQYRYDGRGRMTGKKLPGKGWEFMIYNTLDQLVLSQDALQRNKTPQQWSFSKYDGLGRIVITGIFADAGTTADAAAMPSDTRRVALQTTVGALTTNLWETRVKTAPAATETGYSNVSYPTSGVSMYLSINYYDNYNLLPGGNPYDYSGSTMTKGLLTASRVKVLKESPAAGTGDMLWNLNYYDDEGRVAKSYSQHYKGGVISASNYDEIINSYSFTDELLASTRIHHVNGSSAVVKVLTENKYDHVGRLTATSQQINDGTKVALVQNTYNEVGQLLDKELHNKSQKSTYSYNARGWMTGLNSSQFSLKLKYEDGTVPQWNGNISRQEFTGGSYDYSYDRLNRLTDGIAAAADGRSEKNISYDLNGNIMALQRYSSASNLEDNLTYQYTGNRLTGVTDASTSSGTQFQRQGTTSYSYDLNGNITARTNTVNTQNNLTAIVYNALNLPQSLKAGATDITYVYDATGRKLRKVSGTVATDYISGVQYTGNTLDFIQNEVGRAIPNGTAYKYEYNLSDHLGNVRYSFDVSANGVVGLTQKDDYYPFGMRIAKQVSSLENKYLYNGKEIQQESNLYDYGARFYDPVIGRWNVVDPLAESYLSFSPYNYVLNNPISNTDPDGMSVNTRYVDPRGKTIHNTDDGRDDVYEVSDEKRAQFDEDVRLSTWHTNTEAWNDKWRGQLTQTISEATINKAGINSLSDETVKSAAVEYLYGSRSYQSFVWEEVKAQWRNPVNVAVGLTAFAHGMVGVLSGTTKNISRSINQGKQGKHLVGHNNYVAGKSVLTVDAQTLLNNVHSRNVTSMQGIDAVKTRVNFGKTIGNYVNPQTGVATPTTNGIVINSKTGVHIVPARP